MLQQWLSSNWFSLLLGLAGILATWWYSKRSRLTNAISFSTSTKQLISDGLSAESLDVKLNGKPISALCITTIYLWNSGYNTIRINDLQTTNHLRIKFDEQDGLVIFPRVTKATCEATNARLGATGEGFINFEFDYCDSGDGIKFEIAHNKNVKFSVIGNVIGVKSAPKRRDLGIYLFPGVCIARSGRTFDGKFTNKYKETDKQKILKTLTVAVSATYIMASFAFFSYSIAEYCYIHGIFPELNEKMEIFMGKTYLDYVRMSGESGNFASMTGSALLLYMSIVMFVSSSQPWPRHLD